ncbi:MAG TPA: S8 family serine peptidase [Anaerolineae bacterium]|nr:S8 family serine peptidase [Anaerolineae bacterium]
MKLFSRSMAIFLAVLLLAGTAGAQPNPTKPESSGAPSSVSAEAATYAVPRVYIVRLQDPPVASYRGTITGLAATNPREIGQVQLDAGSPASVAYRQHLEQQQEQLVGTMEARLGREVDVLFRYAVTTNGLAARLTPGEAQALASVPGVVSVKPEFIRYPTTDVGPAWIGAPGLWDGTDTGGLPGTKGEGVVVGVIDTGINFDHPSFADVGGDLYNHVNPLGSGHYLGWCNPANPNYDSTVHKCNDKLIGAWDFTLDGNKGEDTEGHGTHTASTAAGNVTQATINAPTLTVTRGISGVAPHANVVSYDVCIPGGCSGAAILAAIDQAVADGVDVINYSIGGGANDPWVDDDSLAYLAARDAGIFVANSAGNDGPGASTVSSPANAPWLLTVGATTHNRHFINALTGMSGGGTPPPANMQGESITAAYSSHPIVHAKTKGDALCLQPFAAGTWTQGEIVVCDRGINARTDKAVNVQAGGAGGFVLANTEAESEGLSADAYALPGVHLGYTASQVLRTWLDSGAGHMASIAGTTLDLGTSGADIMADFSARGPNGPVPGILKPDVTAPGVAILAGSLNGVEFQSMSGTSMASPHAAGAAALLKDLHPGWTPAEIQSALMTTASTANVLKEDGVTPATPFDYGAGRIDLSQASKAALVMDETLAGYQAGNPGTGGNPGDLNLPSMANEDCTGTCSWTRTVKSVLPAAATWTATIIGAPPGLAIAVTPSTFTLGPGVTGSLNVTANATAFNANRDGIDGWGFAWLELATAGQPAQRLPIAVRKSYASDPLLLTKEAGTLTAQAGDVVAYTVTLRNRDSVANNYTLVDTLPQGVEYVAGSATGGLVYNAATRQLTRNGQIGPGAIDYSITPVDPLPYLNLQELGVPGICASYFPTDCDDKAIAWGLGAERYTFYGETMDEIIQSSNGMLFGRDGWLGQACPACNQFLPQPTEINQVMAGLWRDALPGIGGKGELYGAIVTGVLNNPDDRAFYANWHDVAQWGALTITTRNAIAVVLDGQSEPAGRVYYIYSNITGNLATNGYTVGVEDKYGDQGTTWAFAQCSGSACIPHAPVGSPPANGTTLRLDPVIAGTDWIRTFTYQVRVTTPTGSLLTNVAQATSTSPEPEAQSMWAKADVTVSGPALFVRKTGTPVIQPPGQMVTYTITFGNQGDQDLAGVVLSDTLDAGVNYEWSDPAGSYDATSHEVVWTGLSLPAGSSQTATVAVTIKPGVVPGTTLFNRAYLINGNLPPVIGEFSHLAGSMETRIYLPTMTRNN